MDFGRVSLGLGEPKLISVAAALAFAAETAFGSTGTCCLSSFVGGKAFGLGVEGLLLTGSAGTAGVTGTEIVDVLR
jgi:hypothetical protein